MSSLIQQLEQILNDPGSQKQLTDLAQAMGLSMEPPSQDGGAEGISGETEAADPKQQALIRALLPYLHPSRQQRLERAIEVAQMAKLAGAAFSAVGKEAAHV